MAKAEAEHSIPVLGSLLRSLLERNLSQPSNRPTDTVSMCTVHQECQAAIRQTTAHVQTREQLDQLLMLLMLLMLLGAYL